MENEELKKLEEALSRLIESHLERASRLHKATTGVGCDGFHLQGPLDLTKETRIEVVEFLEKMEQSEKWPQQACTTMFFVDQKNITSERPVVLVLKKSSGGGELASEGIELSGTLLMAEMEEPNEQFGKF